MKGQNVTIYQELVPNIQKTSNTYRFIILKKKENSTETQMWERKIEIDGMVAPSYNSERERYIMEDVALSVFQRFFTETMSTSSFTV